MPCILTVCDLLAKNQASELLFCHQIHGAGEPARSAAFLILAPSDQVERLSLRVLDFHVSGRVDLGGGVLVPFVSSGASFGVGVEAGDCLHAVGRGLQESVGHASRYPAPPPHVSLFKERPGTIHFEKCTSRFSPSYTSRNATKIVTTVSLPAWERVGKREKRGDATHQATAVQNAEKGNSGQAWDTGKEIRNQ